MARGDRHALSMRTRRTRVRDHSSAMQRAPSMGVSVRAAQLVLVLSIVWPVVAQEPPCDVPDDDKQAHRDFPELGTTCADILAAGQCSRVVDASATGGADNPCPCSCPGAEPAAEPAEPQPPTTCASGDPSSGSLLADDAACCDVPGWTDDAGNSCDMYITQGWCCAAGVNEGCNADYHLPGGVDSDHGCCRSCAEYVPPPPPPPPPAGCADDDAGMRSATTGQGSDGQGFTCAEILAAGVCDQIADLGFCGCSCPATAAVEPAAEPAAGPTGPPPTTCASGDPSSGSLLADDAACCDVPGWTDDAGNSCETYIAQGWCCAAGVNEGCNADYHLPGGVDSDHGCCRSCAEYVPPPPPPPPPAGCADDDASLRSVTPGQGSDGQGFTCAEILAAGACSQIVDLGFCGCSCPAGDAPAPPAPTTCASGEESSGTVLADDPMCCDIPGWVDDQGNTCESYVRLGWCCANDLLGCNAAYHVQGGVDSDHGCCRACALNCVDNNELVIGRLLDLEDRLDFAAEHPNYVDDACSYLTSVRYGPGWFGNNYTTMDYCNHWSGDNMDMYTHYGEDAINHKIADFKDICACACRDPDAATGHHPGVVPGTCDDGVRSDNETMVDCGPGCERECDGGCTIPEANNYDPKTVDDDGSCTFDFVPCTDPVAITYDPAATVDYYNPALGPACNYTCERILAAVTSTPCPAATTTYGDLGREMNASDTLDANAVREFGKHLYPNRLLRASQSEWMTPCAHSSHPGSRLLQQQEPQCYINNLMGFQQELGIKQFYAAVTMPPGVRNIDELELEPGTTFVSEPSLWVLSFAEDTPQPESWQGEDPNLRSIRVMDQTAVILYGTPSRPVFNGRWVLEAESFLAIHFVSFRNYKTWGEYSYQGENGKGAAIQMTPGGAAPRVGQLGPVLQLVSCLFENLQAQESGGAIYAESSNVYIERCEFAHCVSQTGGVMMAIGGDHVPTRIVIKASVFRNNMAFDTAGTTDKGTGGALRLQDADMICLNSTFRDNQAEDDTDIQLLSGDAANVMTSVRIVFQGTVIEPYDPFDSVRLVAAVVLSCEQWPCSPGQRCTTRRQSLACQECPEGTFGADGLDCETCPPGHEPNANKTACVACTGNEISQFGICEPCPSTRVPRLPDRHECVTCPDRMRPGNESADFEDNSICYCAKGYYNATQRGLYTCFGSTLQLREQKWVDIHKRRVVEANTTAHTRTPTNPLLFEQCQACPADMEVEPEVPCAFCSGGNNEPQTRAGFVIPARTKGGYEPDSGPVVGTPFPSETNMYDCGAPHSKPKLHCPGGMNPDVPPQGCPIGYAGVLCQSCDEDWHMTNQLCERCKIEDENTSILIAICFGVFFVFWLSVVWLRSRGDSQGGKGSRSGLQMQMASMSSRSSAPPGQLGQSLVASTDSAGSTSSDPYGVADPSEVWADFGVALGADLEEDFKSSSVWKGIMIWFPRTTTLKLALRASFQPLRILITYVQVTSQLGLVLDITYPDMFQALMELFKPFVDFFRTLSIMYDMECLDLGDHTTKWMVKVVVMPSVLLLGASLHYMYMVHKKMPTAFMQLKSTFFFIVFFIYPTVCNTAFEAFSSFNMGAQQVLVVDDRVIKGEGWEPYLATASVFVMIFFNFGVPVYFGTYLLRKTTDYDRSRTEKDLATRIGALYDISSEVAAYVIREIHIGKEYSFLMDAYRPRYYYWEAMDLLRKLALVGVVAIAGRGSAFQVVIGATFSFVFFSMHVSSKPYKIEHDNHFRTATEIHTFFVMLTAFLLRLDDHQGLESEFASLDDYDWALVISCVILVPVAFIWTIVAKLKFVKRVQNETWSGSKSDHVVKQQIDRFILGLADEEDIKSMEKAFDRLRIKITTATFTKTLEGRNWKGDEITEIDADKQHTEEQKILNQLQADRARARGVRAVGKGVAANGSIDSQAAQSAAKTHERASTSDNFYGKFSAGYIGSFADMSDFYGGLEDMIGECRKDLMKSMEEEHTKVSSGFGASDTAFTTSNYMVSTTPRKEWQFVVDPGAVADMDAGTDPATKKSRGLRQRLDIDDLYENAAQLISEAFSQNKLFQQVQVTPQDIIDQKLLKVEIIALRLYTGPLFELYNGVLRAWGNLEGRGHVPAYSQVYPGEDVRNRFTTTIHVINSGVLKLSRLQPAVPVFRGISGMKLPKRFIEQDEYNVRGGVEYAFMSTTTDESVALGYAKGGDRDTATTLIEASMGMVDRGASLDWLSQYPHEREILLPPLTAMEVIDITDYESADSIDALDSESFLVRRLKIRLNCNLVSSTIEKLLSVRKKQVEELAQVVEKDIDTQKKHIDAADIDRRQDKLATAKLLVEKQSASAFNDNAFLIEKMDLVLGLLPKLGDEIEVLKNHRLEVFGLAALSYSAEGSSAAVGSIRGGTNHLEQGFASSSWDGTVLLWELNDRNQYVQRGQPLALGRESLVLTCIDPYTCRLASGQFDGSVMIQTCDSTLDGGMGTVGTDGSTGGVGERVNLVTERNKARHTRSPITALAMLREPPSSNWPQLLASGSMDGEICLWDSTNNRELATVGGAKYSSQQQNTDGTGGGMDVSSSSSSSPRDDGSPNPLGRPFISRTGSMHSSASGPPDVVGHTRTVRALLWLTINGQPKLISCSFDRQICVWGISSTVVVGTGNTHSIMLEHTLIDYSCHHCADEMVSHQGAVTSLVEVNLAHVPGVSSSLRLVASASEDSTIKLWDISAAYAQQPQQPQPQQAQTVVRSFRCPAGSAGVCSLVWMPLPNGKDGPAGWLASGHGNHTIVVHKLFDHPDGSADLTIDNHANNSNINPSSPTAAAAGGGGGGSFDAAQQRQQHGVGQVSLRGHTAAVHALLWLPDRGWLVSGSADSTIRTWRMRTVSE